jgi:hypothetical protein
MKTRLTLTIDETLLKSVKQYAAKKQMSISELVENYFTMLTKSKKNIIDLIESLDAPTKVAKNVDLKKLFYKDKAKKAIQYNETNTPEGYCMTGNGMTKAEALQMAELIKKDKAAQKIKPSKK